MNIDRTPYLTRQLSAGFTLIEVLVAVVVLSVGLLGLAGLQATSMRNNHDAYLTTQATYLANDMADRIRANANPTALAAYAAGNSAQNVTCYTAGGCSPTAMAGNDRFEWDTNLATFLPVGQGTVARAGTQFTLTVMWDELRTGATGTACNPNNPNDLRCVAIVTQP